MKANIKYQYSPSCTASQQQNKIQYIQYVITPKGIAERTKLTINFMKRKMQEYDELKREVDISDSQNFQDKNNTQ